MNDHFMLWDFLRTSEAVLLFPLVVLIPGYVVGWLFNLLAFRQRLLMTRFAIAVPLSIGICPMLSYYLWQASPAALWLFYAACAVAFVILLFRERHECLSRPSLRANASSGFPYLAILIGWTIAAMLALIDMQLGNRLYFPTVTYDYALRAAFTSALSRTGVPPHNPYFFAGHFFTLRYHYFWLILCSIVQQIGGSAVSARQAMAAGTVWCGIGLLAILPLYLRFFMPQGRNNLRRRMLIGAALFAITGLDVAPVLAIEFSHHPLWCIEGWNEQVTSWLDSVMWVPHHTAGLIACLMGFLVLWDVARYPSRRAWTFAGVSAALMFAGAAGMSIYVTGVFAVFLITWMAVSFFKGSRQFSFLICTSGLAAAALSLPFLLHLLRQTAGTPEVVDGSTFPFRFTVRRFGLLDILMGIDASDAWRMNLTNLVALPLNYFLELGFFLIVGVIQCKRMWRDRRNLTDQQWCGLAIFLSSIVICTFVRSTVILANDLGWRGMLIAQFMLLIWGAELMADGLLSKGAPGVAFKRHLVVVTLFLGLAGTLYELVKIRLFLLQQDTRSALTNLWLAEDHNLGARTFALRQIYEELKSRTPETAILQHNPNALPQDSFNGLYADRQVAAETPSCAVIFGGDTGQCTSRIGEIEALFDDPKAYDAAAIDDVCRDLAIDVLVVKDTDKVWRDRESWVWHRAPMIANGYGRAFYCGSAPTLRSTGGTISPKSEDAPDEYSRARP